MKTIASIALAGALAAGTIAATSGGASANGYYPHGPYYPHHQHYYGGGYGGGGDGGAAVAAGIFGLAAGLIASQAFEPQYAPPPPPPYGYSLEQHREWCAATYRTYNWRYDVWTDYQGAPHACVGPY